MPEHPCEAVVRDPSGTAALIRADHNPICPGELDALAEALDGGQVRFISGLLRREGGHPVLDPLAVLTADGLVIPEATPPAPLRPPHPASWIRSPAPNRHPQFSERYRALPAAIGRGHAIVLAEVK